MSENGQIDKIPPGWTTALLSDLVEPRGGKANPQNSPDERFIGMEQVEPHTMKLLGTVPCASMKSAGNMFFPTDVLYGRLRPYLNKVFQPDFIGLCSGEFIVLPQSTALVGRFLKYRLNSADFVSFATHINSGDRPRVDFDQIKVFSLYLPPWPEQERIADALDELLSDLDAGIEGLHQVRKKLNYYRASILKAAVEGALTAEWRAQHPNTEPASELLKRILVERPRSWEAEQLRKFKEQRKEPPKNWKSKYKEPVAPNVEGMEQQPEGWDWATLDQLLWQLRSGTGETSGKVRTDYPVLKSSAVRPGRIDFQELNFLDASQSRYRENFLEPGDFLITRLSGSVEYVGCSAVVEDIPTSGIQYPDRIFCGKLVFGELGVYLSYCFQHARIRKCLENSAKSTAGHQRISMSDLYPLVIALPPRDELTVIVETVEHQLSIITHIEADLDSRLKAAKSLRQSILRHAFEGKLVPQDPNDEPASELLKRIAFEREERTREAAAAKAATTKSKKPRQPGVRAAKTSSQRSRAT